MSNTADFFKVGDRVRWGTGIGVVSNLSWSNAMTMGLTADERPQGNEIAVAMDNRPGVVMYVEPSQLEPVPDPRPLAKAIEAALSAADDMPYIGNGSDADSMVGVRIDGYFNLLAAAEHLQAWLDRGDRDGAVPEL